VESLASVDRTLEELGEFGRHVHLTITATDARGTLRAFWLENLASVDRTLEKMGGAGGSD
jgi:hypothetical protein